jgi:ribosomal protein S2
LDKYLGGMKGSYSDIVIIIGQAEEINAVKECKKLEIKYYNFRH